MNEAQQELAENDNWHLCNLEILEQARNDAAAGRIDAMNEKFRLLARAEARRLIQRQWIAETFNVDLPVSKFADRERELWNSITSRMRKLWNSTAWKIA
jgi:phenylalanine-4-hydroxylase